MSATLPPETISIPPDQLAALSQKMAAAMKAKPAERGDQLVRAVAGVVETMLAARSRGGRQANSKIKREYNTVINRLLPFFKGDREQVLDFMLAMASCTLHIPSIAQLGSFLAEEKINADFAAMNRGME